jgi:hypothetical protein
MINELYELVFEGVDKTGVQLFFDHCIEQGYTISISENEHPSLASLFQFADGLSESESSLFLFKSVPFRLENYIVDRVDVFIYMTNDQTYDIEISLWSYEPWNAFQLANIYEFSKEIAASIHCKKYYFGMEPGCDTETRFFTNTEKGPMRW